MAMKDKRGQNTHSHWERVKIPLLPNNVGKKSVHDSGPTVGSQQAMRGVGKMMQRTAFQSQK